MTIDRDISDKANVLYRGRDMGGMHALAIAQALQAERNRDAKLCTTYARELRSLNTNEASTKAQAADWLAKRIRSGEP
jgi:hypothetical protein